MPLYDLECTLCGHINEVMLQLHDMEGKNQSELNLVSIKVRCSNCSCSVFKKLVSAHGKTPCNWGAWQQQGIRKSGY